MKRHSALQPLSREHHGEVAVRPEERELFLAAKQVVPHHLLKAALGAD